MAFALCSDITIGVYKKVMPNYVKVNKSIFEYVDRALIKVPTTSIVKRSGVTVTQSTETAKLITEGMKVNINLGYNNILKEEFEGFVSRVNFTSPCEIECEGYSYQLRKINYGCKVFKKIELLDVLKFLVAPTDIKLDVANIPSLKIEKFVIQNHNGCEVLENIKKSLNNCIGFFFHGKVLYAGLIALKQKGETANVVKYRLGWNVIKDNQLKGRVAKNQEVIIKLVGEQNNGNSTTVHSGSHSKDVNSKLLHSVKSGTTGEVKVIKTHHITDEHTMQQIADSEHAKLSYNGYEGKITAFLEPFCQPNWKAVLIDKTYPERGGSYLVESTEVTYGMQGGRRIVGIGLKL